MNAENIIHLIPDDEFGFFDSGQRHSDGYDDLGKFPDQANLPLSIVARKSCLVQIPADECLFSCDFATSKFSFFASVFSVCYGRQILSLLAGMLPGHR